MVSFRSFGLWGLGLWVAFQKKQRAFSWCSVLHDSSNQPKRLEWCHFPLFLYSSLLQPLYLLTPSFVVVKTKAWRSLGCAVLLSRCSVTLERSIVRNQGSRIGSYCRALQLASICYKSSYIQSSQPLVLLKFYLSTWVPVNKSSILIKNQAYLLMRKVFSNRQLNLPLSAIEEVLSPT